MPAELVVVKGKDRGSFVSLEREGDFVLGRSETCDLRLRGDKKVSTSHARLSHAGERFLLEDLGSTNGTFVNGERVHQAPLRSGDRIKIGGTLLVFRTDTASVHLSDLEIEREAREGSAAGTDSKAGSSKVGRSSASRRGDESFGTALMAVAEAVAGPQDLKTRLDAALRAVIQATGASRGMLFLRDPDTLALGCACAIGRDGASQSAPVESEVLRNAVNGVACAPAGEGAASASPVFVQERVVGALYVDAPGVGRSPVAGEGRFLLACASGLGLAVRADRLERLAAASIEVVGLAQSPTQRGAVPVETIVEAADRLYRPVAQARGLAFEVDVPPGLTVHGDPVLLSRALDRIVETALVSAKGGLRISAQPSEGAVRVVVSRGGQPLPEAAARELVAAEGPAGDLKGALGRLGDGAIALARAAVARSGGRLTVEPGAGAIGASFVLELPLPR